MSKLERPAAFSPLRATGGLGTVPGEREEIFPLPKNMSAQLIAIGGDAISGTDRMRDVLAAIGEAA